MQAKVYDSSIIQVNDKVLKQTCSEPRSIVAVSLSPQVDQLAQCRHHVFQLERLLLVIRRPRFPERNLSFTVGPIPIKLLRRNDRVLIQVQQIRHLLLQDGDGRPPFGLEVLAFCVGLTRPQRQFQHELMDFGLQRHELHEPQEVAFDLVCAHRSPLTPAAYAFRVPVARTIHVRPAQARSASQIAFLARYCFASGAVQQPEQAVRVDSIDRSGRARRHTTLLLHSSHPPQKIQVEHGAPGIVQDRGIVLGFVRHSLLGPTIRHDACVLTPIGDDAAHVVTAEQSRSPPPIPERPSFAGERFGDSAVTTLVLGV
ncbi:MAG: hypothetical protein IPM16_10230 [Chloroflexi bacterium]|nr:hypothetical protein [Chloroflexota bacterium]